MRDPRAVDRIGPGDLVELVTDVGPVAMNVGAVLLLDAPRPGAPDLQRVLMTRLSGIRRLRQVLVRTPWVLGRPYWHDEPRFDPAFHVTTVACPAPADRRALLALAVEAVTAPLPPSRPLWRAVVVTGLADGQAAVVLVLHHVLADGIGGLAVLARLVDEGRAEAEPDPGPDPGPVALDLVVDAARDRLGAPARLVAGLRAAHRGSTELGTTATGRAPACSLNSPTGPDRTVTTVGVPLAPVLAAARRHGATVNDALLVAVTGAMARVLSDRGEVVDSLVVSVPVSARTTASTADLGNRVGVMPVRVALRGSAAQRMALVAQSTRSRRGASPGASAVLVGPAFRTLAAVGAFRWFVDRQRLVNTFLTNLRGPAERLTLAGRTLVGIDPVTVTAGNVGVAFAAFSYAGTLSVTVIADPSVVPEVEALTTALATELEQIALTAS